MKTKGVYIIAEVGPNHNGDLNLAFKMVKEIAKTGVDAIKFQMYNPLELYSADANGEPKVTEINIRHVAFSSSFANAGFNLAEYHLLCSLDRENELTPELEQIYP